MTAWLSDIRTYPLKSAAGLSPSEARVEPRGLAGDRRWMLVDASGRFLSQREHPRLVLVRVDEEPDGLRVEAPDRPPLHIPAPLAGARRREVTIWRSRVSAAEADGEAATWFSEFLGMACTLVYMPDDAVRAVDPAYGRAGDHVSFADGYPLLVVGSGSMDHLNARLTEPVEVSRFRPNLVIGGAAPYAEDTWERIAVGEVVIRLVKSCARCVVTTVDPTTGRTGSEPLRTLASVRDRGGKVLFGQNAIPEMTGRVRVGDEVRVLSMRDPAPA
jgi:uncharacterized protein